MFARSYDAIVRFVARLRESALKEIVQRLPEAAASESLLGHFLRNSDTPGPSLEEAHVFADSETTLGFDILVLDDRSLLDQVSESDRVELFTRWFVKPGHLSATHRLLKEDDQVDMSVTLGRGDLVSRFSSSDSTTRRQLHAYVKGFQNSGLRQVVLQRYTVALSPSVPWDDLPTPSETHPVFTETIKNLRFKVEDLRKL